MYQPVIRNSYLTEIDFSTAAAPGNGARIKFLDVPQLRNVYTVGIVAYTLTQLTVSPNSKAVVTLVTGMVLTLAVKQSEEIYQIPVIDLIPANNGGIIRQFDQKQFDLPKSYITIFDNTGLAASEAVCFNFIYNNATIRPLVRK